jgi:hypothetical protein
LYGGTAVALRLGGAERGVSVRSTCDRGAELPPDHTLNVPDAEMSDRYVKVSFFGAIDLGHRAAPDTTRDGMLRVASLDDLMAIKRKVLLQRVEAKDYQDIAAMLSAGSDLGLGLAVAKAMFGNAFQPSESLKALTLLMVWRTTG